MHTGTGPDAHGHRRGNQQSAITFCQPNHDRTSGTQTPSATRSRNCKQLLKNRKHQSQSAKHKGAERPSSVQLKSQGNTAGGSGQRPPPQSAASRQLPAQRKARPNQTGAPGQHWQQQTAWPQASRHGTEPKKREPKHSLRGAPPRSRPRLSGSGRGAQPQPGSSRTCGPGPALQNQPTGPKSAPWPC